MLVWTCTVTRRSMVGPVAPEGVPAAGVDEDANPNMVWLDPATGDAAPVPERPSRTHIFDAIDGVWIDAIGDAERLEAMQAERDRLLSVCGHTQLPDYPGDVAAWRDYRQALRDMRFDMGAAGVSWPDPPSAERGNP